VSDGFLKGVVPRAPILRRAVRGQSSHSQLLVNRRTSLSSRRLPHSLTQIAHACWCARRHLAPGSRHHEGVYDAILQCRGVRAFRPQLDLNCKFPFMKSKGGGPDLLRWPSRLNSPSPRMQLAVCKEDRAGMAAMPRQRKTLTALIPTLHTDPFLCERFVNRMSNSD
jgi:hypothetical protein